MTQAADRRGSAIRILGGIAGLAVAAKGGPAAGPELEVRPLERYGRPDPSVRGPRALPPVPGPEGAGGGSGVGQSSPSARKEQRGYNVHLKRRRASA
jgi:hypothetical protein